MSFDPSEFSPSAAERSRAFRFAERVKPIFDYCKWEYASLGGIPIATDIGQLIIGLMEEASRLAYRMNQSVATAECAHLVVVYYANEDMYTIGLTSLEDATW